MLLQHQQYQLAILYRERIAEDESIHDLDMYVGLAYSNPEEYQALVAAGSLSHPPIFPVSRANQSFIDKAAQMVTPEVLDEMLEQNPQPEKEAEIRSGYEKVQQMRSDSVKDKREDEVLADENADHSSEEAQRLKESREHVAQLLPKRKLYY